MILYISNDRYRPDQNEQRKLGECLMKPEGILGESGHYKRVLTTLLRIGYGYG